MLERIKPIAIGLAGSLFLRLLNQTLRWKRIGLDGREKQWASKEPRIIAFWHGQQLLMPWLYLNSEKFGRKPLAALISQHNDGRMVAAGMKFLGINSVAGSSTKRGVKAMFELIEKLRNGSHIAITPDGPKGPAHQSKEGIIRIAQRSGAPIYPACVSAQRKWRFHSWDRMFLPKPFSKAVLIMGQPMKIPSRLSKEDLGFYTHQLDISLNNLAIAADSYY